MAYPNAFTAAVDGVTTVSAALINQLETKVGVNNSTDINSLEYKINHLLSTLTGMIFAFGAATPPAGFLLCDGSAVSRTTYSTLFGIIGTTYGVGNGTTTFNLPDLRQRFPLGKAASGTGSTLGGVGGSLSGAHTHSLELSYYATNGFVPVECNGYTGNAAEANAIPPYQVVNYIIKF